MGLFADSELYVKSDNTKLLEQPTNTSKEISILKKNTPLEQIGKKGMFIKVKYQNRLGWIHSLKVTKNKETTDFSKISKDTEINVKKQASKYSETAAARGLDSEKKNNKPKQEKK